MTKADGRSSESRSQCLHNFRHIVSDVGSRANLGLRVINDRLNVEANLATDLPDSISIEPIGGAPMISFDLHEGTVPGGLPSSEDAWDYQPEAQAESSSSHNGTNVVDRGSIYALPASYTDRQQPTASSSSSSSGAGVFSRDQLLPLSFYVLNEKQHRSTVQTITVSHTSAPISHYRFSRADEIVAFRRWYPRSNTGSDIHYCSDPW